MTKWLRENGGIDKIRQRNYYEHIIRNDESLNRIPEYIQNNPMQWAFDKENPAAIKVEPEMAWLD